MRVRLTSILVLLLVGLMAVPEADARRRRWSRWSKYKRGKKKKRVVHRRGRRGKKKHVVVLGFQGPRGNRARAGFIAALRGRTRVLGSKDVDPGSAEGITSACSKLKCDAVVTGAVKGRGRRFIVTVTVFNGGDGEKIGARSTRVRRLRQIRRAGYRLGKRATRLIAKGKRPSEALAQAPPPDKAPDKAPDKPPDKPPAKVAANLTPSPAVAQTTPPESDDDLGFDTGGGTTKKNELPEDIPVRAGKGDDDDDDDGDDEDDTTVRKRARSSQLSGLFRVGAGFGLARRSYSLIPKNVDGERAYDGGWYPELTVAADVYPLVFVTSGFLRNLGLGASYSRHLSMSAQAGEGSKDDGSELGDSGSQQLLIDLRVRYSFADKVTIRGHAGFGLHDFTLGENDVLTSVNYKFIRVGFIAVVPFGTPLLGAHVGMEARPVLSMGQDVANHFGSRDKAFGWTVTAGVGGTLSFGLFYFASFEYQSYATGFAGLDIAEIAPEPNSVDMGPPSEGNDQYLRFWLGAGYAM